MEKFDVSVLYKNKYKDEIIESSKWENLLKELKSDGYTIGYKKVMKMVVID